MSATITTRHRASTSTP